jgi:hypothetical protein
MRRLPVDFPLKQYRIVSCKKKKYEDLNFLLILLDLFFNRWRQLMYICPVLFYKCNDRNKRGIRMQDIEKLQIIMLVESNKKKSPFLCLIFPWQRMSTQLV